MGRKEDEVKATFFGLAEGFSPGIIDRLLPSKSKKLEKPQHIQDEALRKAKEKRERRRQKALKIKRNKNG